MFGNNKLRGFTYKGYTYDFGHSRRNRFRYEHFAVRANKEVYFDWSPYDNPTQEQFMRWIDLGCPERLGAGPLDEADLVKYEKAAAMCRLLPDIVEGAGYIENDDGTIRNFTKAEIRMILYYRNDPELPRTND